MGTVDWEFRVKIVCSVIWERSGEGGQEKSVHTGQNGLVKFENFPRFVPDDESRGPGELGSSREVRRSGTVGVRPRTAFRPTSRPGLSGPRVSPSRHLVGGTPPILHSVHSKVQV